MQKPAILIIIGLVLLSLSVFLPYMQYDVKEFHGLISFKHRKFIARELILHGSKTALTYFALFSLAIPAALFMIKKSRANAYRLLVFSIVFSIMSIALYFALTAKPSFYNGYYNVVLKLGFWSSCLGVLFILIGSHQGYKKSK